MKKRYLLLLACALCIYATEAKEPSGESITKVEVTPDPSGESITEVTAKLELQRININNRTCQYEVLSYNGTTYLPVRQFAHLYHSSVFFFPPLP